jgi:hypothetical protein
VSCQRLRPASDGGLRGLRSPLLPQPRTHPHHRAARTIDAATTCAWRFATPAHTYGELHPLRPLQRTTISARPDTATALTPSIAVYCRLLLSIALYHVSPTAMGLRLPHTCAPRYPFCVVRLNVRRSSQPNAPRPPSRNIPPATRPASTPNWKRSIFQTGA